MILKSCFFGFLQRFGSVIIGDCQRDCMQLFYNISDPAMEDALYDIESMRRFASLRLSGSLPDETTILNFRHLLEKYGLGKVILKQVNKHLGHHGLLLREGTMVDAAIIPAGHRDFYAVRLANLC